MEGKYLICFICVLSICTHLLNFHLCQPICELCFHANTCRLLSACTSALMEKVMLCINTLAEGCVETRGVGVGFFCFCFLDSTRLIALRSHTFSVSLHGQSFLMYAIFLKFEPNQSGAGCKFQISNNFNVNGFL